MTRHLRLVVMLGLILVLVATSCTSQSTAPAGPAANKQAKAPDKLQIAFGSLSGAEVIPTITKDAGLFDKYNIDADIVFISGSSKLVAGILAGETPIAVTGAQAPIEATIGGGDLVMIAGTSKTLTFWLYTKPEIKDPKQLKGKRIGITRLGSASHFAARYVLQSNGLDPMKDATLIQLSEMPAIVAGLESGSIDAGVVSSPSNITARKLGFSQLVEFGSTGLEYQQTGVATTKSFIAKNEDLVRRFMKAYIEGIHKYRTDKAFSVKTLSTFLKTDDQEVLNETYQNAAQKYLVEVPYPSMKGIQTIIDEMAEQNAKAKQIKPEDVVDLRFMKELDESGFIKQVTGK